MADNDQNTEHHLHLHKKPKESGKRLTLILVTAFVAFTIVFFIIGKFMGGHPAPPVAHPAVPAASASQTVHQGSSS
ncbi:hypothetical protein H7F10_07120 [Acidithiobacillus sp. HP-6]|uniref:hypothetical protein n=1 Tax=unclassified Acidithiobacillus TaxID=2614800 RepID=UPI001879DA72|nr:MULTISPECIES: hypothetical protein [unclassified Acidithiobacillus]MBE7562723.1 hypothetical protein [Acidithiobacillus sp. HP-6]MBE7570481.1 hypothetical protein [Acidithiobacillus sp. HP-2]